MLPAMNAATKAFIARQQQEPNVLGIILFGSWARGNNRPDSDVDLVIILRDGYRRAVESHDGQLFEIIYVTEEAAFEFWKNNRDDCAGVWEVATLLFDRDGTVARLEGRVRALLQEGKPATDEHQLGRLRFDAEDQIAYAERVAESDPTTAGLVLTNKVFALTEVYFDVHRLWTPAPKARAAKLRELDPRAYRALQEFHAEQATITTRVKAARELVEAIFSPPR
jgi:predicted nucleotidyltransferase